MDRFIQPVEKVRKGRAMKPIRSHIEESEKNADWCFESPHYLAQSISNKIAYEMLEVFADKCSANGGGDGDNLDVTFWPFENCDAFASFDLLELLKEALVEARDDPQKDMKPIKDNIIAMLEEV